LGGSKSVSSGIGREFRALSVAHLCIVVCLGMRNAIAIVTHKKHDFRGIWLEKKCVFWDRSRIPGTFRCANVYISIGILRNAIAIVTHKNQKPAESGLKKVCLLGSVENSGHFPLRKHVLFVSGCAQCNSHRNTQNHETRGIWLEKSVSSGIGREFRALSVAQHVYRYDVGCAMQ